MYRHCTFCSGPLGENEVIESFPVGRRLAFDGEKGRLWVVCGLCERWNLTPLEERWEAVEEGERLFRETPLRVSTEQIGLARHREGLELVRIGRPLRPEFAAWRYGDQFGRRRRRYVRNTAVVGGIVGGVALGSGLAVGGLLAFQVGVNLFSVANLLRHRTMPSVRVPLEDGDALNLRPSDLQSVKLRPGRGDGGGDAAAPDSAWHLSLEGREGGRVLTGGDAVRTLRAVLPRVNPEGAGKSDLKRAVRELEEVGDPERYFHEAELRARRDGWGYMSLPGLPRPTRLALEMAVHEDVERAALEGELTWLEETWREAEELAAIADDLALPEKVRIRFEELKARYGRPGKEGAEP